MRCSGVRLIQRSLHTVPQSPDNQSPECALVRRNWSNPEHSLTQQWHQLDRELQSLNQRLNSDYDAQAVVLQTVSENRVIEARRLVVIEGQILNTEYLLGWTSYFLGILQADARESHMSMSDAHFRTFLQIEPKRTLNEVPADWFDFSSDWNSRALVGLGMCQRGLDHPLQSKYKHWGWPSG